jgi:hypothetical protein
MKTLNERIIEKQDEFIKSIKELNKLCEAPQYNEIVKTKEYQKRVVEIIESELSALKSEHPDKEPIYCTDCKYQYQEVCNTCTLKNKL